MGVFRFIDRLAGRWLDWRTDRAVMHLPEDCKDIRLHKVDIEDRACNITLMAPGVAILAEQAADLLEAEHAENYVQFNMMPRLDRGLRPILVTVQWAYGEAPGKQNARLRAEVEQLKARIAELTTGSTQ